MNLEQHQVESIDGRPLSELSFEEAMAAVDALTRRLESGELSLAESLAAYQRGASLLKHAQGLLEQVQKELDIVDESGHRSAPLDDFLGSRA